MAHEHKTIEECQRACTMSPGCKAFDAGGVEGTMAFGGAPQPGNGNQEIFQAGDCFMSYDTIGTIKAGDVGMTNQLELFQKVEAQKVQLRVRPSCAALPRKFLGEVAPPCMHTDVCHRTEKEKKTVHTNSELCLAAPHGPR